MNITRGTKKKAQRIVVYGTEGVGKSTFTSQLPNPVFIDTEDGTDHMDVARLDKPTSWSMLMGQVSEMINGNGCGFNTLVIDTADWAEKLCVQHVCDAGMKQSVEDFGYGKGYVMVAEEFSRLLNQLSTLRDRGVNICMTAHSIVKRFDEPQGMDSYDRHELKLEKKTSPLLKEWADAVLFADYETIVVESEGGKKKGIGGSKRVLHTVRSAAFDAKNRWGMAPKIAFDMPFDFSGIAPHLLVNNNQQEQEVCANAAPQESTPVNVEESSGKVVTSSDAPKETQPDSSETKTIITEPTAFNTALFDLMKANNVTDAELEKVVEAQNFFPAGTPCANYGDDFVNGMLIPNWATAVLPAILSNRTTEPNL